MEGEIELDSHSKSLIHKMNLKVQTAVTVKKTLPKGLLARQCKFLGQKSLAKLLKRHIQQIPKFYIICDEK